MKEVFGKKSASTVSIMMWNKREQWLNKCLKPVNL